jgi:hypothetical protein
VCLLFCVVAKAKASEQAIQQAKAADHARYETTTKEYETNLEEWQDLRRMAEGSSPARYRRSKKSSKS